MERGRLRSEMSYFRGKHLIALSDKGELSMVEATPSYYKELARKKLITGKCWSTLH